MNPRRLYRSRRDRQLAGVAGGMAEYLDLDPTLVRVLWIVSVFFGGFTLVLYVILAFVIPLDPSPAPPPGWWQPAAPAWAAPPAQAPAPGPAAPGTGTEPAGEGAGTAEAGDAGTSAAASGAGAAPDGGAAYAGWAAPRPAWVPPSGAWASPASGPWGQPDQRADDRRGARGGLFFGVLLVAFGTIALANVVIPGWSVAGFVWPAFILALGVALVVGSIRRTADGR